MMAKSGCGLIRDRAEAKIGPAAALRRRRWELKCPSRSNGWGIEAVVRNRGQPEFFLKMIKIQLI
jgi:hypothetical protein